MRLDRDTLERLDQWRAGQPELPSRAEAVRRLVHTGLAVSNDEELMPSSAERLILALLCDLARNHSVQGGVEPEFVQEAISAGHYWAIESKYPDLVSVRRDPPEVVQEVRAILEMWTVIEYHYDRLEETDRALVKSESKLLADHVRPKFLGFYANEESGHLSIAEFVINRLEHYPHFENRRLNTQWAVLDWYRRMLRIYEPMREKLLGRSLTASEIVGLLKESIHPDSRKH